MTNDVFVVVRSVGERTEDACIRIAESQLSDSSQLAIVKGIPFGEAHMESIRLALDSQAQWALFLDADIMLKDNAIETMLAEAMKIAEPFFQLNFRILDRGFGGESYGIHFYSTKHFRSAYNMRDHALTSQRPEYSICSEIAKRYSVPSITSTFAAGLHGFEQYYSDLYRTAFVRSIKYKRHLDYFLRRYYDGNFQEGASFVEDRFMFWGVLDGMLFKSDDEIAPLDKNFYTNKIEKLFHQLNITERPLFLYQQGFVKSVFDSFVSDNLYDANKAWICPTHGYTVKVPDKSISGFLRSRLNPRFVRVKKAIKILMGK